MYTYVVLMQKSLQKPPKASAAKPPPKSLRLRRSINSNDRLRERLLDLAELFKEVGYPTKMISEITSKVQKFVRDISVKHKKEPKIIIVVTTHEADDNIVEAVKDCGENLKGSKSFRNQQGLLFKYVEKVGPNIRTQINTLKYWPWELNEEVKKWVVDRVERHVIC